MKTRQMMLAVLSLGFFLFLRQSPISAAETQATLLDRLATDITASTQLDKAAKELIQSKLLPITTNPILIAEVKSQNAKNISLETIKKTDDEWKAKEGEVPLQEELMANATATELNRLLKGIPQVVECFVMDNKGANVGQINNTSDYWQGDEPKWEKSFNNGQGGIEIGKKEIDESTAIAQQQVSLPLSDSDGAVVGAITFGITVAK